MKTKIQTNKSFVNSNSQIVKKHFDKVNREGVGFLHSNIERCTIELDINTLALVNESFEEVIRDLKKNKLVTDSSLNIVTTVQDLIITIVSRRLNHNGQ